MKPFVQTPRRINQQILLAVLTPVIVLTIALTAYYTSARLQDLKASERVLGVSTTSYLAQVAELAIYAEDSRALKRLARATMKRPSVNGVAFLDQHGQPLAQKGQLQYLPGPGDLAPAQITIASSDGNLLFARPIHSEPIEVEDFDVEQPRSTLQSETIGWVILSQSRDEITGRINGMLLTAALIALAAIATGVLFALKTGAGIGRPVRDLTRHIRQLDQSGSSLEFEPSGTVETIVLASGINQLVERIRVQLQQQSDEIDDATAALSARNRELEEAHRVLEQALQAKDDFLARMSHELRTPLTTIIGFNRLINSAGSDQQTAEYSRHIEHASTLLHSIIDDILDYSRLQSTSFELEHIAFNLEDCFEDVVGMHGYEAVAKRLELVLLIDAEVPRQVIGDPQRLQQVVNNLVANALKFTGHGEVVIRLTLEKMLHDTVRVACEIRDTGIGIPGTDQSRLFQPFTQADNSINRKYGGSGLGLAISQSLVGMMGGNIVLSSTRGQGTTVSFSFEVGLDRDTKSTMGQGDQPANLPLLAYDSNDWSRRALRAALVDWSLNVSLCADRTSLMTQLGRLPANGILILGLSHNEAQTGRLSRFLQAVRARFNGPILVLSPMPESAEGMVATGVVDNNIEFALKPLRRQRLIQQCVKLSDPRAARDLQTPIPAPLKGLSLLVAEDHALIRDLISRILQQAGAKVEAVADGEQAVLACLGNDYDLLLMDLHMPRMDGVSASRSIRAQGDTMPIICLTADVTAGEREVLGGAGVDAVLLKPINEGELIRQVCLHCKIDPAYPVTMSQGEKAAPSHNDHQVKRALLQLIHDGRDAFMDKHAKRFHTIMHDLLGLAGMYEEKMLHEMIREMKREGFALSPEEASHLFAEAETLVQCTLQDDGQQADGDGH